MLRRIGTLYARRIVNVNVNVVLAGALALAPTLLVVKIVEHMLAAGVADETRARLHVSDKLVISGTTFFADILFDVAIYYLLHWLANHWRRPGHDRLEDIAEAAAESVPFFHDATKVQLQRMVISPLLYVMFLGIQFLLMHFRHTPPVLATAIGFGVAIVVARTIHTAWMLREERYLLAKARGQRCAGCGHDLRGVPNEPGRKCPACGKAAAPLRPALQVPGLWCTPVGCVAAGEGGPSVNGRAASAATEVKPEPEAARKT